MPGIAVPPHAAGRGIGIQARAAFPSDRSRRMDAAVPAGTGHEERRVADGFVPCRPEIHALHGVGRLPAFGSLQPGTSGSGGNRGSGNRHPTDRKEAGIRLRLLHPRVAADCGNGKGSGQRATDAGCPALQGSGGAMGIPVHPPRGRHRTAQPPAIGGRGRESTVHRLQGMRGIRAESMAHPVEIAHPDAPSLSLQTAARYAERRQAEARIAVASGTTRTGTLPRRATRHPPADLLLLRL